MCYTVNVAKKENSQALYNAVALCAVGAEKVVSNELKKLGLGVTESAYGKVRFKADIAGLYRSLMGLRAADRVLLEAASFHAADFDALFEKTQAVAWEKLVPSFPLGWFYQFYLNQFILIFSFFSIFSKSL